MKKYFILQNTIMHYRIPLFEGMARRQGVQLTVIHSDENIIDKEFHFKTKYIPKFSIFGIVFQPGLKRNLVDADVILCMFNIRWISIVAAILSPKIAKRVYLWTHGYGRISLFDGIRFYLVKRCKGLVLYYRDFSEMYVQHGIPETKIYESSNTVLVSNHGFLPDAKKDSFLYVGRLQERKKIDLLIVEFSKLARKFPSLTLKIVGEGEIKSDLSQLAQNLGIESRVKFYGRVIDEEVLKSLFQRAYAYVSPGHVGLGVLHAFAYGCPVVTFSGAHHAPEYVNLRNKENAILIDGNSTFLSTVLQELIVNPNLSFELGRNAYNLYTSDRTMDKMIENLVRLGC